MASTTAFSPPAALRHCQRGQIVYVDRLQVVLPIAEYAEDREVAQHPGDVVDQDVFLAEEHGRAQDGVGQPRSGQGVLQDGLASEVFQG